MRDRSLARARRVAVAEEPLLAGERHDYADSYEVRLRDPDGHSSEQWARAALEQAPWAARETVLFAWQYVLGFRLGPRPDPDHVLGWQILTSRPEVIQFEAWSPLMRGVLVGRRVDPTATKITTFLFYRHPAARLVWTVVGPLHRALAPLLIEHAATRLATSAGSDERR